MMENVVMNQNGVIVKMIRERTELYYKKYPSKVERWYQFYIYLPKLQFSLHQTCPLFNGKD